jgi:ADP-heptose:LPS heptosyltransferase/predicted SAM-dependent methyltransferase
MTWAKEQKEGNESEKIRWELVPYTRGLGLDIGCGPWKPFPHFIGVDNRLDSRLFGVHMNPDLTVPDATKLPQFSSASHDFIYSSHMLEHVEDYKACLKEWWRIVKPGGHLCLYLPHKDFYPNIGKEGANPDHKHDFVPQDIVDAMLEIGGWDLVRNEDRNEGNEYSFFQVYKKYADRKVHRYSYREPKPTKTCAIVRYGAWGDVIQTSSVLPELKRRGYHITLYTVPRALEAIEHEPLIDAFVVQDQEQVPNAWLGEWWAHLRKKYELFINLSESVEASLLAMSDRAPYYWTKEARHSYMNRNYLELMHLMAGVPYEKPLMRFVATDEEREWVRKEKAKFGADPLIMWVLRGSAVHKVWCGGEDKVNKATGMDQIIARILIQWPKARIVMVGDESCKKIIETPWQNEPRVVKRSGEWSIRETMAFAKECDMVIGPETGVMNAVAMEPMRKIVFLSHSTVENLTRDWHNTVSLYSKTTECYPCHRMIHNWSQCNQEGETGIAKCQAAITPEEVWDAIRFTLDERMAA